MLAALLMVLAVGTSTAVPHDPLRDRVEALLGAIDRPVDPAEWRALGPDAVPVLEEIAAAPRARPSKRARAVEGLAAIGGPRAEAVVLAALHDKGLPWPVRVAAARGAGGLLDPSRLTAEVRPALDEDPEPRVRAVAAEVLARLAPAQSCPAVRARAAQEPAASRALFRRALQGCP